MHSQRPPQRDSYPASPESALGEESHPHTDTFASAESREAPPEVHPMALDDEEHLLAGRAMANGGLASVGTGVPSWTSAPIWKEPKRKGAWSFGRNWLKMTWLPARLVAIGWMAYILIFNLSIVRGSSMAPGIHDGDRIVVDQFSYIFSDVERGDIVVLRYPLNENLDYIKRVVGVPGDLITMAGGLLWINGERVEEAYTLESDPYSRVNSVVKPGHYFVLGDNRLHSSDSREFGQVRAELVRGKVDFRLWPFERIGILD